MSKTVLVTGSGGFIGRAVVARLLAKGYRVVAMLRSGSIPPFVPHPNLSTLYADITKYESFCEKVEQVEAVVHLAANKYHPKLSYQVNLTGARNLVRLVKEQKIKGRRVINISSQSTKIKYRGVYGESKRLSDEILEVPELEWTTLKPSLVYGAGSETLFATIRGYVKKLPVVPMIGSGKWELYPLDVEDLAIYISRTIELKHSIHKVYDLGDPKMVTFDQLIGLIEKELKVSKPIFHLPVWIGLPLVYLFGKLMPRLPVTVDNVLGSTQNTHCDPKPAIKELGLKPISTRAGVKKYLGQKKEDKLRIAVVGLGKMGIMHASLLNTMREVRIVAIVDQDKSLGKTAQSMGIAAEFFSSLPEAIKKVRPQAVYICTPTFAHKEVIQVCQKHSLPYFVEKPVFPRYSDWKEVAVKNTDMAGYFWVYKREVEYTKRLLSKSVIGKVKKYEVVLKHSEVFGPKKGWLFKKELSGGGVVANPGPHALSIAQFLFGKGVVKEAKLEYLYKNEVEDKAELGLVHPGGVEGKVLANWSVRGYPVMTIEYKIWGSKGEISFANNTLTVGREGEKQVLPYSKIPATRRAGFVLNPQGGGEAYYRESRAFVEKVISGRGFVNDMAFARKVEKIISESYEKAK